MEILQLQRQWRWISARLRSKAASIDRPVAEHDLQIWTEGLGVVFGRKHATRVTRCPLCGGGEV